jgi:hypothetical protein
MDGLSAGREAADLIDGSTELMGQPGHVAAPPAGRQPESLAAFQQWIGGNNPDRADNDEASRSRAAEIGHIKSSGKSIKGLNPVASDALKKAGFSSRDVLQGLGNAPASKGTHRQSQAPGTLLQSTCGQRESQKLR